MDTNVLVRYLVWDDDVQSKRAAKAIEDAEIVIVSTIVLCEMVWVLSRVYKYNADEMAAVLRTLIETENVEVDRAAAEAGLASLEKGGDFADGVVLFEADKARADLLVTFDQSFAATARFSRVKQL